MPPAKPVTTADPTGFHTLDIISRATAFNRWMYSSIRPFLQGNILEIGSGIGNISDFVVRDGYTISLSDYDADYQSALAEKYHSCPNVPEVLSIDLEQADFTAAYVHLQNRYDTIFLLNVIEHIRDDRKAVQNCAFLLKPQGRLVVLAPAFSFLYSRLDKELGHHRRYTTTTMTRLLTREELLPVHRQYFNALGLAGWFVFGLTGRKQLTAPAFNLFNILVPLARLLDRLMGKLGGLSVIAVAEKKN